MRRTTAHRITGALLVLAMLLSLLPATVAASGSNIGVQLPEGKYLIAQTDYTIASGVTETQIIMNDQSGNAQVRGYMTTIAPTAQVEFKASYSGYYTKGSTAESRKETAKNLPFDMKSTTKQAADFEAATGRNVLVATNADYYNMQSGQALGYLIMEGNVVQTEGTVQDGNTPHEPYFATLKDGSHVIRDYGTDHSDVLEAISGPFFLVRDGQISGGLDPVSLMPRNSVGVKADGTVVLFLADGRQDTSVGMTLVDMAQFMLNQGCVNALYLDGGGSATIASKHEGSDDLAVRNTPSDGTERVVASTLLLVSTAEGSGIFDHASLSPNNQLYIAGATVTFLASGVDTTGRPAEIPQGATWSLADSSFGSMDAATGVFTSNGKCGTVTVNLNLGGKVVGSTSIEVQEPESLFFASRSLNLAFNATSDLGLRTIYKERDMDLSGISLNWSIEPTTSGLKPQDIGSFEGNLFTAVKAKQTLSANITVSYTKQDGTVLSDTLAVEIGRMPQVIWDFEPDENGELLKCAEYDWGNSAYGNYFGDENLELTYIDWNDETNLPATVTKKGPFQFGGTYIGDLSDRTYFPACYIFGSAGYSFFTWHTTYMQQNSAQAEVVSSENGQVRFGDYALRLDYDYTNLNPGYRNVNQYLYYSDTSEEAKSDIYAGYAMEGTPSGLGVWVYAPEGTPNYWLWSTIAYYDVNTDTYKRANVHFTTQEGRSLQYNGIYWEGWMYLEADLRPYAQYSTAEHPLKLVNGIPLLLLTYIPGGSANENGDKIPMGAAAKGSLYFDNFRVVYGDTVDDMEMPEITSVQAGGTELAEDGSTVVKTRNVRISAAFQDPASDNATGINAAKTAIYVDGLRQALTTSTETDAAVSLVLPNGTHSVTVTVSDGFGNVSTITRYFTVTDSASAYGTVTLSGDDAAVVGETYTLQLAAKDSNAISQVSARIRLSNTFGEPTVTFPAGCTGESALENGILTIQVQKDKPAAGTLAEVTFQVSPAISSGAKLTYSVESGTFLSNKTSLSFAQPTTVVGVTAPYTVTADVMTAGGNGKIYVTKADGTPAARVEIYTVLEGQEDTLVGKTNSAGVLVTNRFCQTVGENFTIYAKGSEGLSFRYSSVTTGLGSDEVAPTNLRLNAVADSATTASISWFSAPQYTEKRAVVQYVEKSLYDSGEYTFSQTTGTCATHSFTYDNQASQVNNVTLTGLTPGTVYCYRVGDGVNGHWSEIAQFTTGVEGAASSFFIMGDTQLSGNVSADADDIATMNAIAEKINAAEVDFGIQTGDFIDNAGSLTAWNEILDVFSKNYSQLPLIQVMGNHEYYADLTGGHAETIFDLPDEDYYSVEYGNVYIAVINCNANLEAAAAWLVKDAAETQCSWKVVTMHQPPYYTNPKGSSAAYNQYLPSAIDEADIDFVFSGHDHSYARTEPLTGGQVDEENGAVYFICGDLGEKSRSTSYTAENNPDFHFAAIDQEYDALYLLANTTATDMTVTAYNLDGTIIDSYTMHHSAVCETAGHKFVYDRAAKALTCSVCGEAAPEAYTGWATDKDTGKDMYFLGGQFKTGWFTIGTDLYHFGEDGLSHLVTVVEDIPTTCDTQGHKTVQCECGESETLTYGAPTGHEFVEVTAEDGSVYYYCTKCGMISDTGLPFNDVRTSSWYYEAVKYCYENDYMRGITTTTFGPKTSITREMLVTILWRISGAPVPESSTSPFTDKGSNYSMAAIRWAAENELVLGYPDGTFRPKQSITREEMVTFFYRYAKFLEMDVTVGEDANLNMFADADRISNFAKDPALWAASNGIVLGIVENGVTNFQPKGTATRGQVAAIIMRLLDTPENP